MGNFPWGPHGQESAPNQVKPNPTPQDPVGSFAQPGFDNAQPSTATGGANPLASIAVSLIMAPLVWMFWVCLYPLTAAVSIVTGFVTGTMLQRVLTARDEASVAQLGGVIAGFVAAIIMSRIEYKLAQNFALRWARHAVRLLLFGTIAFPWFQALIGYPTAGGSSMRYLLALFNNPRLYISQLFLPQNLAAIAIVMVITHFVLWKADRLRAFWHRRLFWIGLK